MNWLLVVPFLFFLSCALYPIVLSIVSNPWIGYLGIAMLSVFGLLNWWLIRVHNKHFPDEPL